MKTPISIFLLDGECPLLVLYHKAINVLNMVPITHSVSRQKWRSSPPAAVRRGHRLRVLGSFTPALSPANSRTSTATTSRMSLQTSSLERSWRKDGCQEKVNISFKAALSLTVRTWGRYWGQFCVDPACWFTLLPFTPTLKACMLVSVKQHIDTVCTVVSICIGIKSASMCSSLSVVSEWQPVRQSSAS